MTNEYLPILILFIVVSGFVVSTMALTHLLGPKRNSKVKNEVFECGIPSTGNARSPFAVHYALVAILFVLFDVEVVFFYPWAVNFKALGTNGFLSVLIFTATICLSLAYVFKHKLLDFEKK
jgi:NADH-quinone oxidoreductase subunit A